MCDYFMQFVVFSVYYLGAGGYALASALSEIHSILLSSWNVCPEFN